MLIRNVYLARKTTAVKLQSRNPDPRIECRMSNVGTFRWMPCNQPTSSHQRHHTTSFRLLTLPVAHSVQSGLVWLGRHSHPRVFPRLPARPSAVLGADVAPGVRAESPRSITQGDHIAKASRYNEYRYRTASTRPLNDVGIHDGNTNSPYSLFNGSVTSNEASRQLSSIPINLPKLQIPLARPAK